MGTVRRIFVILAILALPVAVGAESFMFTWQVFPTHSEYGDPVRYGLEFSFDTGAAWEEEIDMGSPPPDACGYMQFSVEIVSGHPGQLGLMRVVAYYPNGQRIPSSMGCYKFMRD